MSHWCTQCHHFHKDGDHIKKMKGRPNPSKWDYPQLRPLLEAELVLNSRRPK